MHRSLHRRWLSAVAIFVALPVFSSAQLAFRDTSAASEENTPAAADIPSDEPAVETRIQLPHENMGDIYVARQRYQAALAEYKQVRPPTAATWNKMAIAYQMLFDTKDAIHCYKQSLRLNKHDARVYNNLGTVYDSLKNYKEGERNYRKSLKLQPDSALTLKNLGTNLLMQHKYDQGNEAYAKSLMLEPDSFTDHGGPTTSDPAPAHERGTANYFKAISCARAGLADCAFQYLRMAINEGVVTAKKMTHEAAFAPLRDKPTYQKLLAIAK